jgi:hypothetical protein
MIGPIVKWIDWSAPQLGYLVQSPLDEPKVTIGRKEDHLVWQAFWTTYGKALIPNRKQLFSLKSLTRR